MANGNEPGTRNVLATKPFAGRKIKKIFAKKHPRFHRLIEDSVVVIFEDGSHFTIVPRKDEFQTADLLIETKENVVSVKGTAAFLLKKARIKHFIVKPELTRYEKLVGFPHDFTFLNLVALANSPTCVLGEVSIYFGPQQFLLLEATDLDECRSPNFYGIESEVAWEKPTPEEVEELGGVLLHNEFLTGQFEDRTGQVH